MPPEQLDGLPTVKAWLAHAPLDTTPTRAEGSRSPTGPGADAAHAGELAEIDRTVERNVLAQIDPQRTHPHVRDRLEGGGLDLHAWVFDIREGRIRGHDPSTGHVVEL